jgi:putative sterol carrier protein
MGDATAEFFEALARRGHEPLLAKTTGTVRVEIVGGERTERWLIAVDAGDVAVSRRNTRADCTVRCDRDLFGRVARGEANAMAAVLRGAMTIEGHPGLLVLFQRLFSTPAQ